MIRIQEVLIMDIGIIGGADGPTAIFIASSVNWGFVVALGVVALGAVLFLIIRKRRQS